MHDDRRARDFADKTIGEISSRMFRETTDREAEAPETAWTMGRLSFEGLDRVTTFLQGLIVRSPLNGPLWQAHRAFLEAVISDMSRELERRRAEEGDDA